LSGAAESARLFFAIWPSADVVACLIDLTHEIRETCRGRLMRPETLHLTLAFLGTTSLERQAEAVAAAADVDARPFDFTLDRIGYWRHNQIVWAGADSPELTALANRLSDSLRRHSFELAARPLSAHVTLLRNADCRQSLANRAAVNWSVRDFVLVRSEQSQNGSRYTIIGRWPLIG
jgi:2'-5' RNA ligase